MLDTEVYGQWSSKVASSSTVCQGPLCMLPRGQAVVGTRRGGTWIRPARPSAVRPGPTLHPARPSSSYNEDSSSTTRLV